MNTSLNIFSSVAFNSVPAWLRFSAVPVAASSPLEPPQIRARIGPLLASIILVASASCSSAMNLYLTNAGTVTGFATVLSTDGGNFIYWFSDTVAPGNHGTYNPASDPYGSYAPYRVVWYLSGADEGAGTNPVQIDDFPSGTGTYTSTFHGIGTGDSSDGGGSDPGGGGNDGDSGRSGGSCCSPPPCDSSDCCDSQGMPTWGVSEAYVSLWLHDQPLGYVPAKGPAIGLRLAFKQRETAAGYDPSIFSVGKKWNFSWLSFITHDHIGNNVAHLPGGRETTFKGPQDYNTNTRLTGDATNGFSLTYPDGSTDIYGFLVTNSSGVFQKAFLTQRWNAHSQKTTFYYAGYDPANPIVRLQSVVDGDGRTNSISYVPANAYSTNLISQVVDAFGRTNSLSYDSLGHLTTNNDVAGISSSFIYDTNDWVTSFTTPYGTTSFNLKDSADLAGNGRSVLVSQPDGGHHLYLYTNGAPGIASSYASVSVPDTTPLTNTLENTGLDQRNTFYWAPRQYANLSTANISSFSTNDFRKARMRHWLNTTRTNYGVRAIGSTLSLQRDPSPDPAGTAEGQKTWFDYVGKTNTQYEGTQVHPLFTARVLPDDTSQFTRTDRNSFGSAATNTSTWSVNGSILLRTTTGSYATDDIDRLIETDSLANQVSSNVYNSAHQVLTSYNALGEMTGYTYNSTNQLTSITRPTGLITTNIYGTDGQLATTFDYAITAGVTNYYRTNSYTYTNNLVYTHTDERGLITTNLYDNLQRLTNSSDSRGTISYVYSNLDLVKIIDRLGFTNSFVYDSLRRKFAETNALGFFTVYNYCSCGSLDSIRDAAGNYTYFFYDNAGRRTTTVYPDGYGITNNFNLLGQVTNTVDSSGYSLTNWFNNQGIVYASSNAFGRVSAMAFDSEDRATNSIDANGVSINSTFDALGRVLSRSYPDGGIERFAYSALGLIGYTNQLGFTNTYTYDPAQRKLGETNANGEATAFTYSAAGDLLTLTDAKHQTTTWQHDAYGRVTDKLDALGTNIFHYEFDANNRLTNRVTPAKGSIIYTFDALGNLKSIQYPVSSNISFSYDSLNRLTNMVDAVGTTVYSWDSAGQLLSEDGPWPADTVTYSYANRLRTGLSVQAPNSSPWIQGYTYGSARRFHTINSLAGTFTYAFDAQRSTLPALLTLPNGAFITNSYDSSARLLSTVLKNSGGTNLDSWSYSYNQANQRTNVVRTDGSTVSYSYDKIGQLTGASGVEANGTTLRKHEQFVYYYDAAGNLALRTNNALGEGFNVNTLNELTTVTNAGTLTVAGTTTSAATNVTVNGATADRYGDFTFAKDGFPLTNGSNSFMAIAADSLGRRDTNTLVFNRSATNIFAYDLNGNLRTNGTQVLDYDDENQLTAITVSNSWRSEFIYDGKRRRRMRREYTWESGIWNLQSEIHYVYDGNLPIQERDASNLPTTSYTRGLDLSGSLQSAGGIGGLLARTDHHLLIIGDPSAHAYYHADGNGNITALVNANQFIAAKYLYTPFGETVSASGPLADANLYRFSSKEFHPQSGLVYYLYRCYIPGLHRWLNSDPIEELGGRNLYAFVHNTPEDKSDPWGLATAIGLPAEAIAEYEAGIPAEQIAFDLNLSVTRVLAIIAGYQVAKAVQEIVNNAQRNAKGKDPCQKAKDAVRQVRKGIDSLEKVIQKHQGWINDPASYGGGGIISPGDPRIPQWINDWMGDIAKAEGNIEKSKAALNILEKAVDAACRCWYLPWTWF